jgi:hypothetical protein
MSDKTELLPCPFCGGAPSNRRLTGATVFGIVECKPCDFEIMRLTEREAEIAWNRRATIRPTAAEPVYFMRQLAGGDWVRTDADEETSLKRMPHWRGVFEFLTLYTAPVAAAQADAVRDAVRLDKFIDWYLREGKRCEVHEHGYVQQTTREHVIAWLDASTPKEPAK